MTDTISMPPTGTWEHRGGWVVAALANDYRLSYPQAAGIVGNLGFESVGFTKLHEIGQAEGVGGYGWAQWTAVRRRYFMADAAKRGLPWQSDAANMKYLEVELDDAGYAYCLRALRKTSTVEDATLSWGIHFEAPGGTTPTHLPGYLGRLAYARRALAGALEFYPEDKA